jgi:quinol monooxygenase YgiN
MLVLAVTWIAKEGQEEKVVELFRYLSTESRKEPGCRQFQVHRHVEDRRRFFIYEQFDDEAALDAHRAAPHFASHAKVELPRIADRIEGQKYEPLD